jgi:hypothetical protein
MPCEPHLSGGPHRFLWMTRLNMAESRVRSCTGSLVRLDQTSLVLSAGLEPVNFPLFHRDLVRVFWASNGPLCMLVPLVC